MKPVSISCEIATDEIPVSVPSKAAETVPEYVTSSPRFKPRLMPEKSSFGRSSFNRCRTPQFTQSVGVPSTDQRCGPTSLARSGWWSVSECPAALRSWSGATVKTSPTSDKRRGEPLDPLREDAVVVGDEDPGPRHAAGESARGITNIRMM